MNAAEANVLLTYVEMFDGRFKRNPEERAEMASAWADALDDVTLGEARQAVRAHYRQTAQGVMPSDIRNLIEETVTVDVTERRERDERDRWLRSHGIQPSAFDEAIALGIPARDVLARAGVNIKELEQ